MDNAWCPLQKEYCAKEMCALWAEDYQCCGIMKAIKLLESLFWRHNG